MNDTLKIKCTIEIKCFKNSFIMKKKRICNVIIQDVNVEYEINLCKNEKDQQKLKQYGLNYCYTRKMALHVLFIIYSIKDE